MPRGRPTTYTEEIGEAIALALEQATCGLSTLCDGNDELPPSRTVWDWVRRYPDFSRRIQRAREVQAERLVYEGAEILDGAIPYGDDGNNAAVALAKHRAEYRLKLAPKIAPRTMGDRQAIDLGGQGENGKPIEVVHTPDLAAVHRALEIASEVGGDDS